MEFEELIKAIKTFPKVERLCWIEKFAGRDHPCPFSAMHTRSLYEKRIEAYDDPDEFYPVDCLNCINLLAKANAPPATAMQKAIFEQSLKESTTSEKTDKEKNGNMYS